LKFFIFSFFTKLDGFFFFFFGSFPLFVQDLFQVFLLLHFVKFYLLSITSLVLKLLLQLFDFIHPLGYFIKQLLFLFSLSFELLGLFFKSLLSFDFFHFPFLFLFGQDGASKLIHFSFLFFLSLG